jgi:Ribosomal protein L11 methylase
LLGHGAPCPYVEKIDAMNSFCLSCILPPELKEIALAQWFSLGMTGCQESETSQGIEIKCFFKGFAPRDTAKAELLKVQPDLEITVSEVANQDWNAQWKASMKPALIAPGIWVSPDWLPPQRAPHEHWIKIEPGMAFGTGHHATTRLAASAVQNISQNLPQGFSLLDIGTGTGVLCFIAELYGAEKTIGIDIDPVCAGNLAENRRENPAGCPHAFAVGTIDMLRNAPSFDCIAMNMISSESEPMLENISGLLKVNGYLIWSGLLIEEKNSVIAFASEKRFYLNEESSEEEWWCGVFQSQFKIIKSDNLYI